jgi:hypothetical protein
VTPSTRPGSSPGTSTARPSRGGRTACRNPRARRLRVLPRPGGGPPAARREPPVRQRPLLKSQRWQIAARDSGRCHPPWRRRGFGAGLPLSRGNPGNRRSPRFGRETARRRPGSPVPTTAGGNLSGPRLLRGAVPARARRSFSCDTDAACEGFLGSQQEWLPPSAPPAAGRRRPGERPSAPRGRSAPSATRRTGRARGGVPRRSRPAGSASSVTASRQGASALSGSSPARSRAMSTWPRQNSGRHGATSDHPPA